MSLCPSQMHPRATIHPLYSLLLSYVMGLIAGFYWHPPMEILWRGALALLVYALYCLIKGYALQLKAVHTGTAVLLGILLINFQTRPQLPFHHVYYWANNQPLTVEGSLYRPAEHLPDATQLYVKAQWIWARGKRFPVTGNIFLTSERPDEKFLLHDRVMFSARLRRPRNFGNPGAFDYQRWLAFQDIYVTGYLPTDKAIFRIGAENGMISLRNIDRYRQKIRGLIDSSVPSPANSFLRALLLGDQWAIPEEIKESFTRTGTAHILAISGLNLGIVAAVSYWLARYLLSLSENLLLFANVPKVSAFLSFFPMSFYALIAGAGVSVQRAFIMIAAYIVGLLCDRERNPYHALALAALIILALQPSALFGISFQLSFLAVWGIIFFSPRLLGLLPQRDPLPRNPGSRLWEGLKHKLILYVVVSLSAMVATGPTVAYHFNLFSLSSLPSNLVIVPLAGTIPILLALCGAALTPFSSFLATVLFHLSGFICQLVIDIAVFLAHFPWASFLVTPPSLSQMLLFYICVVSLFLCKSFRFAACVFLVALFFLGASFFSWNLHPPPRSFRVTFVDVGQGDAALLQFPGGENMLLDAGGFPNHRFDAGKNIVAPFLLNRGVRTIHYLAMSHPHPDHFDGLRYIAKNFSVREFWYHGEIINDPFFRELLATIEQKNVEVKLINSSTPGRIIQGVRVDVLFPPPSRSSGGSCTSEGLNNRSLVLKFSYGNVQYLFPGDIYSSAEEDLLRSQSDLSAHVLKMPHHGSMTSANPDFIKKVGSPIAICSVGAHNPFHLPHPRAINLYRNGGCRIYRTDRDGAIATSTDGKTVSVGPCGKGAF